MFEPSADAVKMISVEQINPEDRFFAISLPWSPIEQLNRSVGRTGLLAPLHIQKTAESQFRIVMGFRRFFSCRNLGIQNIPCWVRVLDEDPLALFIEALEDNLATRELHILEKAHVLLKLRRQFSLTEKALMEDFMPPLEIRADRFHLDQYLDLAQLPRALQRNLLNPLEPDTALKLAKWKDDEQDFFLELTTRFQLGKNKQKQLFTILDELRALQKQEKSGVGAWDLPMIWQECEAADIERNENLSVAERFGRAFEALRRLRFPHLTRHEMRYKALKAALKIPPRIHFEAPPYFEGDRFKINFSFGDPDELSKIATKLDVVARTDELKEIFKLV
ncbi:MAG: ParB N-terminal domain-containing protein [Acidobacteriota bacterium]